MFSLKLEEEEGCAVNFAVQRVFHKNLVTCWLLWKRSVRKTHGSDESGSLALFLQKVVPKVLLFVVVSQEALRPVAIWNLFLCRSPPPSNWQSGGSRHTENQ